MTALEKLRAKVEEGRRLCHRSCFNCGGGNGCEASKWREAALKLAEWIDFYAPKLPESRDRCDGFALLADIAGEE